MNNLFCIMYSKLVAFFKAIGALLGFNSEQAYDVLSEDGFLTVIGKNCIEIYIGKYPKEVEVILVDENSTASCNPHQDKVDYSIVSDCNCNFYLKVKWDVDTVRTVYWKVIY